MAGMDQRALQGGSSAIQKRLQAIFNNRGVGIAANGETEAQRLQRITREVQGGRSFDDVRRSVDMIARKTSPTRQTAKLPGLSAEDLADLTSRRRAATSAFERALAEREAGMGRINAEHRFMSDRAANKYAQSRGAEMAQFAGRGVAFQPRFAGQMIRRNRAAKASEMGALQLDKAERLAQLQAALNAARGARDNEISLIEAEKVRRAARLNDLIRKIGG